MCNIHTYILYIYIYMMCDRYVDRFRCVSECEQYVLCLSPRRWILSIPHQPSTRHSRLIPRQSYHLSLLHPQSLASQMALDNHPCHFKSIIIYKLIRMIQYYNNGLSMSSFHCQRATAHPFPVNYPFPLI